MKHALSEEEKAWRSRPFIHASRAVGGGIAAFLIVPYFLWQLGADAVLICRGHDGVSVPDCETFYLLLNEIDGGGPVAPSDGRPLKERVAETFAPFAKVAGHVLREPSYEPV